MIRLEPMPGEHELDLSVFAGGAPASSYDRWVMTYGFEVAEQLDSDARYTLVSVGANEFAYTDYERCLRALGQAWAAGFVPTLLCTVMGRDLLAAAPHLRGVDLDLTDLSEESLASPHFS